MPVQRIQEINPDRFPELGISKELLLKMWYQMNLIRQFEMKVEELSKTGALLGPTHSSVGQEAIPVGVMAALEKEDVVVSNFRGHGHAIARGVPTNLLMAEILGKSTGTCKGVGGSMHSPKYLPANIIYATSVVGSGIPIAAGAALAVHLKKEKRLSVVFFGDGASNAGAFHESCNMASLWKLPLLLVCENNQFAHSTRAADSVAGPGIAHRAEAYGMPGTIVDGNDVLCVFAAAQRATRFIREGGGPSLLECQTYRMRPHSSRDVDGIYRKKEEVDYWAAKDPIERLRKQLLGLRMAEPAELDEASKAASNEVEAAMKFADDSPMITLDDLAEFVYV